MFDTRTSYDSTISPEIGQSFPKRIGEEDELKPLHAGYGKCSLCSCPGFFGSGQSCSTCGHHYTSHW